MTDNLTDRIAQVISRHHGTYHGDDFEDWYTCRCDLDRERFDDVEDYDRHLAAAIVDELGLRRIVDYCEQQAIVGWRDVGTADEAMGRNIVAEAVLSILEGVRNRHMTDLTEWTADE